MPCGCKGEKMSRVVKIKGKLILYNLEIAKQVLNEFNLPNVVIQDKCFIFEGYDYYDGRNKSTEINQLENRYNELYSFYLEQLAEQERKRIEEEKRLLREQKKQLILKNAEKQGYKVKRLIEENNTIKLVLQKRVY